MAISGVATFLNRSYGDTYKSAPVGGVADVQYDPDRIIGHADFANHYVSGDVYINSGSMKSRGGDDFISVSAFMVTGDSYHGESKSYLFGGNDTLRMKINKHDSTYYVSGDVYGTKATVRGGDDKIFGARKEDLEGNFYGDARFVSGAGAGYGGDDKIKGTFGGDLIIGDFEATFGAHKIFCGDDRLFGLKGNDAIMGDVHAGGDGVIRRHGNDVIFGGGGNDALVGDGSKNNVPGGHDRLFGNSGADRIYGGGSATTCWLAAGGQTRCVADRAMTS